MLKPATSARLPTRLPDLGVVRVQGVDAVKFLQGQVSNDVTKLGAQVSVLAGLHNAQGRAIALLRLVLAADDEVIAILPRELAGSVATRLAKFVLRAKAKVSDASLEWEISGIEHVGAAGEMASAPVGATRRDEEGRLWVRVGTASARWLVVSHVDGAVHPAPGVVSAANGGESAATVRQAPTDIDAETSNATSRSRDEWRALDIADGLPQVYAATSEAFVAQMLNLDVVGGIAFDKGCYTGQEVIARAHYRGKVKRRMQRFQVARPVNLKPGDSGTLRDGRGFKVVDAVSTGDGRCEFLAVTTISANGAAGDDVAEDAASASSGVVVLDADSLPLPYSLPA